MMHTVFKRMVATTPPPFNRDTVQVERYEVALVSADPNSDPITILDDIASFEGACAIASHLNGGAAPGIEERMVTAVQSVEEALRGVDGSLNSIGSVLGIEDGEDNFYSMRRQLAVIGDQLSRVANQMPN